MINVFLSSVFRGLENVRRQVLDDLRTARYAVVNMESFGSRTERPLEVCLKELRTSDVVLVVVGPRYGSLTPNGEVSYTHEEFREARRRGIPVLAFILDASQECNDEERRCLQEFADEAGEALTHTKTVPDQLSAKMLASLTSARDRGDIGSRYSPFQSWDKFFAQALNADRGLHSHSPFFGRENELARMDAFVRSEESVLVITASGGVGKSRLLLEMARRSSVNPTSPRILFVDAGDTWNSDDINRLPTVATILVVDDAHRRPDLDRLIAASRKYNSSIRFIVSCRPGAIDVLRPHLSDLVSAAETLPYLNLTSLPKDVSVELARACLGTEFVHLADQLVRLADRNALVISVGGRCIAAHELVPEVLDHTAEQFRTKVLDRLLEDPALNGTDADRRHRMLEVLATIGPIDAETEAPRRLVAKYLEMRPSDLARLLGELERAGFVQRRGRFVRVSPDVLADHLLYRAAIDQRGKTTGFVDEVLEHFGWTFLGNILANAAELDWRGTTTRQHDLVLTNTWQLIREKLPQLTHRQRADLVDQLKRPAVFAPEPVLRIAEWLCDHQDAPTDSDLARYGIEDSPRRVLDSVGDLLGFLATHPDFTTRCLARLWKFAEVDDRPTNPNPGHPRRKLTDLLKYDRNFDPRVQEHSLVFLVDKLQDESRSTSATWAVEALSAILARSGEANYATKRAFTFGSFSLATCLQQISDRRYRAIECLTRLALGERLDEAAMAIDTLGKLLLRPHGLFGRAVPEEEVSAWLPEAKDAADRMMRICNATVSPVIRYLARRELREKSREHWPAVGEYLDELLRNIPALAEESFFDILVGVPWAEQLDDWKEEQKRLGVRCIDAATSLWEAHREPARVQSVVLQAIQQFGGLIRTDYVNAWTLAGALVETRPAAGASLARAFAAASHDHALRLVPPVLAAMKRLRFREAVEDLIREFSAATNESLRTYVADSLRYVVGGKDGDPSQLALVRPFLNDQTLQVRCAAVRSLAEFSESAPQAAIDLLVSMDWGNDLSVAEAVCGVLNARFGLDPELLSAQQIDGLLAKIGKLQTIEGGLHDVLEFIAFASTRRPRQTVEMLIDRVRRCAAHRGRKREDTWIPIPYNGHGLTLPGLVHSEEYLNLLRLIRDVALEKESMVRFWTPELFQLAATDLNLGIAVLKEWLTSGDPAKVTGVAHLLRGYDHSILFSSPELVADLLEAASLLGDDCLQNVRSELFGVAIGGVLSGTPGQPTPRHVAQKSAAAMLADRFNDRPVVTSFYQALVQHADESIRREMAEFDEGDDE